MKKIISIYLTSFCLLGIILLSISGSKAETTLDSNFKKPGISLIDFDTRGYNINNQQAIQFVINELISLERFEVMDKYEVEYIAKSDNLTPTGCFSKVCLTEFGKHLKIDKIFTGSMQLLGQRISITLRLMDVSTSTFEKTLVKEFLDIPGNELMMIRVTMNEMFDIPNNQDLVNKLTLKSDFDNTVNNPYKLILRSDGPRIGIVGFSGLNGQILKNKAIDGGFNSYPFMFQFGYQFEKQYLNEGNFQALVELIPNITGMDQGRLIPSFTFLNGLRNNKKGWEFAFGPTFNFTKMASGFYDDIDKKWHLESEKSNFPNQKEFEMIKRLDSRGSINANAGFLFAIGKTFKSGKMNIPLNFFFIPGTSGARFGLSFGWNGRERIETNEKIKF